MGAPRYGKFLGISRGMALAGSIHFDMADLPHAFVAYLTRMFPWFQENSRGWWVALAVVVACAVAEYCRRQGGIAHLAVAVLRTVGAFVAIVVLAPFK